MEASEEYIDIDLICRICLAERGTVNIFGTTKTEKSLHAYSIPDRIMSFACVEVLQDDGLPRSICFSCLTQIDQAFKLKAQCEYADATLREMISSEITDNILLSTSSTVERNSDGNAVKVLSISESSRMELDMPSDEDVNKSGLTDSMHENNCNDQVITVKTKVNTNYCSTLNNNSERLDLKADKENKLNYVSNSTEDSLVVNRINSQAIEEETFLGSSPQKLKRQQSLYCADCGKLFLSTKLLEEHGIVHSSHRPFMCSRCGKSFLRLSNLREHEKRHSDLKRYLCSNCGQLATGKNYHYCKVITDKSKKSYPCNICDKKFVTQRTLTTHRKRHNNHSKFTCNECGKPFYSRQELERHLRVHFGIRPFICSEEECSLSFYSQGELNRHLRYHTGEKNFSCDLCNQRFFESGHLANHQKKHLGERSFKCSKCPKAFFDSSKLASHVKSHMRASKTSRKASIKSLGSPINQKNNEDPNEIVAEKILLLNQGNCT